MGFGHQLRFLGSRLSPEEGWKECVPTNASAGSRYLLTSQSALIHLQVLSRHTAVSPVGQQTEQLNLISQEDPLQTVEGVVVRESIQLVKRSKHGSAVKIFMLSSLFSRDIYPSLKKRAGLVELFPVRSLYYANRPEPGPPEG